MFDIGWSELLVIGVVALIAIGPKELPGVLRAVGHWMGKIRRMASEFQGQFQEAMREAELADVKKQFEDVTSVTGDLAKFDPLADMQKLVVGGFASAMDKQTGPAGMVDIAHTTKLALIDADGNVRGYYSSDEVGIDELFHRSQHVLREQRQRQAGCGGSSQ